MRRLYSQTLIGVVVLLLHSAAALAVTIDTNAAGVFEGYCSGLSSSSACRECMTLEERRTMPRVVIRTVGVTPGSETESGRPISHVEGAVLLPVVWRDAGKLDEFGFCDNVVNPITRRGTITYDMVGTVKWNENGTGLLEFTATFVDAPQGPKVRPGQFSSDGGFWRAGVLSVFDTAGDFVFRPGEDRIENFRTPGSDGVLVQENGECQGGGSTGPGTRCFHIVSGAALTSRTGDLAGKIESTLPTITDPEFPDRQVHRAVVTVYEQLVGPIRAIEFDETDAEYQAFLKAQPRIAVATRALDRDGGSQADTDEPGRFAFDDLPAARVTGSAGPEAIYYTIEVTDAETDEVELDMQSNPVPGTRTTLPFADRRVPNVTLIVDKTNFLISLEPLTALGTKRPIIDTLSQLCPNNYADLEVAATAYLDSVENGMIALDAGIEEAINRGIWAERTVGAGVRLSDELIKILLDGYGTFLANIYDDVTDFTKSDLAAAKKRVGAMKSAPSVPDGFGVGSDAARDALADISLDDLRMVGISELAARLKAAVKALAPTLEGALIRSGTSTENAGKITRFFVTSLLSVLSAIESGNLYGGSTPFVKFAIGQFVNALGPKFIDGPLLSYCALTAGSLQESVTRMTAWQSFDDHMYLLHRRSVVDDITVINEVSTDVLSKARQSLEIANGLDGLEGFTGLLAKGAPWGRAIDSLTRISKYLFNGASFGLPGLLVYGQMPPLVEEGVYDAFGATPPSFVVRGGSEFSPRQNGTIGAGVLTPLVDIEEVTDALASVKTQLLANAVGDAIEQFFGSDPASYRSVRHRWQRSMDMYLAEIFAIDGAGAGGTGVSEGQGETMRQAMLSRYELLALEVNLTGLMRELSAGVLSAQFSGPSDADYLSARLAVLAGIPTVTSKTEETAAIMSVVHFGFFNTPVRPVLFSEIVELVSVDTGGAQITQSPETFALRVRVKNLSDVTVSDLSAALSVGSPKASVSINGNAEQAVGSGTLMPDDGVDGSGPDEAMLEWMLDYAGDLSWEMIGLNVNLLENGEMPVTFPAEDVSTVLAVDPLLSDADLDGMPDDVEEAFGLDTTTDDSEGDLDGDGLSNAAELRNGTDPSMASSDADALSDLEELTRGSDGFITDPLDADTDGDGVDDATDGAPRDPSSTDAQMVIDLGEPEVAVDTTSVELSDGAASASITVTNAGTGDLLWIAETEDPALIVVSPGPGDTGQANQILSIGAREGFDFAGIGLIETKVTVIDVGGADKDGVEITVWIGGLAGGALCGHGVDSSVGGSVTASDALVALLAAVGVVTCELCRCDVDSSGATTATDALKILRKAVGQDVELTCVACG